MVYRVVTDFIKNVVSKYIRHRYFINAHERYARLSAGFDIETTRIETRSYMWCWTLTLEGDTCYCRQWKEFEMLMESLQYIMDRNKTILIIWVANLGYEFSFIGRRFQWKKVFAIDAHAPLTARTGRIEFRECLTISGHGGLNNLAKNYTTTQKMVGDLDYDKIRISSDEWCTPTDETEDQYIINDTVILSEWGQYIFSQYVDQNEKIPLTQTSIVRNEIKKGAAQTGEIKEIRKAIYDLFPVDRDDYNFLMKYLFRGGYTHSNVWNTSIKLEGVVGVDFTSSYPAVMLHYDMYPVTKFIETELKTDGKRITDERIRKKCCYFVCEMTNVRRTTMHAIESKHKIMQAINPKYDNGRLYKAERIQVCLTEIDYRNYEMFYDWDEIIILTAYTAFRGKLPEYLLRPLRNAYKRKKQLKRELKKKGLETSIEYENIKAFVNSFYGCTVTRLHFIQWKYSSESGMWEKEASRKSYEIMRKNQLLSPFWGIYVTALARHCLLQNIRKLDPDQFTNNCVYSDTDSIYFLDSPENRAVIEQWNRDTAALNASMDEEFSDLGCFDFIDGGVHYQFKTLGAKRYIKYHEGIVETVVAGMRKKSYEKMICSPFRKSDDSFIYYEDQKHQKGKLGYISISEMFDRFDDGLTLTIEESEKNRAAYNPNFHEDLITDDTGHSALMHELSSCAIVPVSFNMKMYDYIELIEQIMNERRMMIQYD